MKAEKLGGRPISPVLRPHFITESRIRGAGEGGRDSALRHRAGGADGARDTRAAGAHATAAGRAHAGRGGPGYSFFSVTGLLDTSLNNGSMRFVAHHADAPAGVVYGDTLADLYYEAPPVKEFRKKYKLKKLGGTKSLLSALLKAYKEFGGKQKKPRIAIVEFRQPFQSADSSENALLAEYFTREGYPDRGRLAGSARISQRRSAPRRIRHRHRVPPHQAPGIPGALRSDRIPWCAPTKIARCAW